MSLRSLLSLEIFELFEPFRVKNIFSHLVHSVLNFFDVLTPTRATAAAGVVLLWGRAHVARARLRHDGGPMRPGVAGLGVILCIA